MTRSSAMLASFGFVKTTLRSTNPRVASPDLEPSARLVGLRLLSDIHMLARGDRTRWLGI